MTIYFFRSRNVSWSGGPIRLRKATWHSCMKWGWPSLNRGEHAIEWCEYVVLSIRVGTWGASWQVWPKPASWSERTRR